MEVAVHFVRTGHEPQINTYGEPVKQSASCLHPNIIAAERGIGLIHTAQVWAGDAGITPASFHPNGPSGFLLGVGLYRHPAQKNDC